MNFNKKIIIPVIISTLLWIPGKIYAQDYTVKSGDSLYTISKAYNITIQDLKLVNNMTNDIIYPGQVLKVNLDYVEYTVKSGDSLWIISQRLGISIDRIKAINKLSNDNIYVGQKLKLDASAGYTVKSGDTLWIIANKYGTTIQAIKETNGLISDEILIGQILIIPKATKTAANEETVKQYGSQLLPVASQMYTVKAGDTISSIAVKFGASSSNLMKYNYLNSNDWLNEGQIIAINGYAPRNYTVAPGESSEALRVGKLVDWFLEGQYIIKRNDIFTITDVLTGQSFKVIMMGGYNHIDIETLSSADTEIMYKVFNNSWQWMPRAVVIYKDGMNIAASLSGMPHSFDSIANNNMSGHCDLYLYNSKPHGAAVSTDYVDEHRLMVLKAAGK